MRKKTEQVNVIGLSRRYLAGRAVSQLGPAISANINSAPFISTFRLGFDLPRPREPSLLQFSVFVSRARRELNALICFKHSRRKVPGQVSMATLVDRRYCGAPATGSGSLFVPRSVHPLQRTYLGFLWLGFIPRGAPPFSRSLIC